MMRCSAVGAELEKRGFRTVMKRLEIPAGSAADPAGTGPGAGAAEAAAAAGAFDGRGYDAILLDSYHTSAAEMECLRAHSLLICMDDTLPFRFPADMIINYNLYAEALPYKEVYTGGEKLLLGERYIPLRPAFREAAGSVCFREGPVRKVLLSAGGADPADAASLMLDTLPGLPEAADISFILLLGKANPRAERIAARAASLQNVEVRTDVSDMVSLYRECDLAVSAAGTTLQELCIMGVPAIAYILADNQVMNAHAFAERGLVRFAGDAREQGSFREDLHSMFTETVSMPSGARRAWSERMRDLNDGRGAERTAEAIAGAIEGRRQSRPGA